MNYSTRQGEIGMVTLRNLIAVFFIIVGLVATIHYGCPTEPLPVAHAAR